MYLQTAVIVPISYQIKNLIKVVPLMRFKFSSQSIDLQYFASLVPGAGLEPART